MMKDCSLLELCCSVFSPLRDSESPIVGTDFRKENETVRGEEIRLIANSGDREESK